MSRILRLWPLVLALATCAIAGGGPGLACAGEAPAAPPSRHVGIVLYDGHVVSEVVGPYIVFARAGRERELVTRPHV